jgi:hypothetical protein
MKANQILNKRYADLCQTLGDLEMNKEKLMNQIDSVRKQILAVEAALPLAQQVEQEVRAELAPDAKVEGSNE